MLELAGTIEVSKYQYTFSGIDSATFQKTAVFTFTSVRTPHLKEYCFIFI